MIYQVEFVSKARRELLDAWQWYEDRQVGLGDRFVKQVFDCVNVIAEHPLRYPERRKFYREALVKIFPYLIIYRISKRKRAIAIVSVFHGYRHPAKKYRNR